MVKLSAARMDMQGGRVDASTFKQYGETLVGGSAGTNTTATYTVDLSLGNVFNLILNANCAFTFANPKPTWTDEAPARRCWTASSHFVMPPIPMTGILTLRLTL